MIWHVISASVTALVDERNVAAFAFGEMRVAQHQENRSPLTVLHVTQPVHGGVARVVADLVRAQTRDGTRTVVACPPGGGLGAEAAAAGAEVATWQAGRAPGHSVLRETADLARIVRETAPDLVHAHSAKAGLAARLAVRGRVPTVFQPHAWSFEAVGGGASWLALWLGAARRPLDRPGAVRQRRRAAPPARDAGVDAHWAVVRNGVDLGRFGAPDRTPAGAPARYCTPCADLPDDAPLVVLRRPAVPAEGPGPAPARLARRRRASCPTPTSSSSATVRSARTCVPPGFRRPTSPGTAPTRPPGTRPPTSP